MSPRQMTWSTPGSAAATARSASMFPWMSETTSSRIRAILAMSLPRQSLRSRAIEGVLVRAAALPSRGDEPVKQVGAIDHPDEPTVRVRHREHLLVATKHRRDRVGQGRVLACGRDLAAHDVGGRPPARVGGERLLALAVPERQALHEGPDRARAQRGGHALEQLFVGDEPDRQTLLIDYERTVQPGRDHRLEDLRERRLGMYGRNVAPHRA